MASVRIVVLAGLLLAAGVIRAQDEVPAAPAGTWKVMMPSLKNAQGRPVLLVKLEKGKEDKWKGEVLGTRLTGKDKIEKISVNSKGLAFTIKSPTLVLQFEVKLPDPKARKLYGEAVLRKDNFPVELERSSLANLDEEYDQVREEFANEPLGIRAVLLARLLLSGVEDKKVKPAEARAWAEKAVKSSQLYGPRTTRETLLNIARTLAEQKGFESTALQYAKRAEAGLDEKAEGPAATKEVLDVLEEVLNKAGKEDEAKLVKNRLAKLDFRIKPAKYAGRKAKHDRVVLAEVFTTAHAKPGVVTNMAIDALQKTYRPTDLNVIVYYQHQPAGDALASPEAEERLAFYDRNIKGFPAMVLNGKVVVPGGGGVEDAQERYDKYVEEIEPMIESEPKANLTLSAVRKGDKIDIAANVSKLDETGEDIKLRVVLVEADATYKGKSGGSIHYNIARAMPGGFEGTVMKAKSSKKTFTVDLADLKKKLAKYHAEVEKKRPFPDKERPLDLKKLRVIAFIQNDANNEVLQSAQVDVKSE